jgi:YD repeat-containing protein
MEFDALSRQVLLRTPTGKETSTAYNTRGLIASVTEPSGESTTFVYDDVGRPTRKTDAIGTTDEPVRQVNGRPAVLTGPASFAGEAQVVPGPNTITVEATDGSGNVGTKQLVATVTGSGEREFTYDGNGNVVEDGSGRRKAPDPL